MSKTGHLQPSARKRGYDRDWDAASADFKRANPHCLCCATIGVRAATGVTDHVVPHKGDKLKFWDRSRWQPACGHCHSVIKQKLEAMFAIGRCTEAELWLNSPLAQTLRKRFPPKPRIGLDGWPVN